MILSWLTTRKPKTDSLVTFKREIGITISRIGDVAPNDSWLQDLNSFKNRAEALSLDEHKSEWNRLAKDVMSIYGAMGSFNDNVYPGEVRKQQYTLYSAAEDVVRLTRRALGGTWFDIPESSLFESGERVVLVQGETISQERNRDIQEMDPNLFDSKSFFMMITSCK